MSDKYKLLVNGDYGASDESDSESVQPVADTMKSISNNTNYSQNFVQSDTTTTQAWSVLYDQVSGYPYYWNPSTNEVKWEKPLDLEGKANDITKQMNEDNATAKDDSIHSSTADLKKHSSIESSKFESHKLVEKSKPNKLSGKAKSVKSAKSHSNEKRLFIGPSLPPEVSNSESQKMDSQSNLVGTLLSKIEDQIPPDWKMSSATFQANGNSSTTSAHKNTNAVPPAIYSKSFKWKKADTLSAVVSHLEKDVPSDKVEMNEKTNPISLIAHGYGDDDDDSESEDNFTSEKYTAHTYKSGTKSSQNKLEPQPNSRKRKIEVKVKSQKHTKDQLSDYSTPAASSFQDSEIATENTTNLNKQYFDRENDPDSSRLNCKIDQNTSDRPNKNEKTELKQIRRRDISDVIEGPTFKKSIDNIAEILCDKLESLEVHAITISPLKLLAIQIETLFEAWHNGALSAAYMQKFLTKMQEEMSQLEGQEIAPPGWRVIWNRYSG